MSSLKRVYTAVLGNAKWLLVPLVAVAAVSEVLSYRSSLCVRAAGSTALPQACMVFH